jgi:predicted XRE-type DNA-binding protein
MRTVKQKNIDVRAAIKSSGLQQWKVAERYGISEGNFSRLLRKELPESVKRELFNIIGELMEVEKEVKEEV